MGLWDCFSWAWRSGWIPWRRIASRKRKSVKKEVDVVVVIAVVVADVVVVVVNVVVVVTDGEGVFRLKMKRPRHTIEQISIF